MPYIWRCQISYNGSGTFLINSAGQPVVPGTTITTTAFNALTADLASGLTTAMTKDGQTVPTANIPMGGFKLTGLGAGTSATDAAQFGQLQNAPVATLITVSGADTITGTLVQTLTAYATGQQFSFVAAGTNTTAVTLNIDGLGAKAVTRTGAVALAAGALVSGQMAIVEYDGTRFQLINANAFTNLTVSGALTVGTTLAVTGVATLTAQPILSSLTASLPVFSDASKGLVSNTMTGTGSVMMSASPTTTGTLTAAAINASGLVAMAGAATVGTTLGVTGTSTMAAINASGVGNFTGTTDASSTTTGMILTAGGISAQKRMYASGFVGSNTGAVNGASFTSSHSGVASTVFGFNNSGSTSAGVTNLSAYIQQQQDYPIAIAMSGSTIGVFSTTGLAVTGTLSATGIISANNNNNGIQLSSSGGSGMHIYGGAGTHQWDIYLNSTNLRIGDNTGGGSVVIDTAATVGGTLGVTGVGTFNATASASSGSVMLTAADPTLRFNVTGGTADKSKYEWRALAGGGVNDYLQLRKINDANTVFTELLAISNAGAVTIPGTLSVTGIATSNQYIQAVATTAPPAGGTNNAGFLIGSSGLGILFGSGAPTCGATKGTLYLRTDGTGVNDRMYVNTSNSSTWTAVVTVG